MATTTTTGKVLFSDTAGAVLATKITNVIAIFWVADQISNKDIATDDDFLLSNRHGQRIIGKRASFIGDDLGIVFGSRGVPFDGLTITTLDGGVCYVIQE